MGRITEIKNIQKHRREVQRIAKEKGYSFPFHDFIKMINVLIFGDKIATKLHRKFSGHHAKMTEAEKARKRTRKNYKKEVRARYKYLMRLAKYNIKNATENCCFMKRGHADYEFFALWLVAKKLEAKGFKCELDYNELKIDWN